jgi:uncharacterized protein (DUF952 family)
MRFLFKITGEAEWNAAVAAGRFEGSAADVADGFIHLSDETQVRETAARHFAGQHGLVLVAFAEDRLPGLKWEPSRGGALFPHVYAAIDTRLAQWAKPLPLIDGVHRFPPEIDH